MLLGGVRKGITVRAAGSRPAKMLSHPRWGPGLVVATSRTSKHVAATLASTPPSVLPLVVLAGSLGAAVPTVAFMAGIRLSKPI